MEYQIMEATTKMTKTVNDLEEIVDGVLQIEEEVSPSLVRPEWELMGYHSRLHT